MRNRMKHAGFARNLRRASASQTLPRIVGSRLWSRCPIPWPRTPGETKTVCSHRIESRLTEPVPGSEKETARGRATHGAGRVQASVKGTREGSASLLVLHVARHEREQLTRKGEHVFLGKTARAKLSIDVFCEDFDRARVGFGAGRSDGRGLRHY